MDFSSFSLDTFIEQFHFIRPQWFLALIPLMGLYLWLKRTASNSSGWQSVIPSHLYQHMVVGKTQKGKRPPFWLLAAGWLMLVISLAGPTWERLPQPVYQLKMGHVIVLDMSLSMRATDMTPDRLTRAKYKAIDLVNAINEGEMGLVAYAGDAFVISPLTEDAANITALLPSLSPEIMPVPGSDPLLGIESAVELLTNAGYNDGMIYWITDGIDFQQQSELQEYVSTLPFKVNALTVGTPQGAPIRQLTGELLKDATGSIVIPKLNKSSVKGVINANGGTFASFTANDDDVNTLASLSLMDRRNADDEGEKSNIQGDQFKEMGPYILLLLVPFAAFAFKRGVIFALATCLLLPLSAPPSLAQEASNTSASSTQSQNRQPLSWWQKPFLNADQEGHSAFKQERFKDAAKVFENDEWKASSLYKSGDYEAALDAYKKIPGADSLYNQGNALAKLGQLEEALKKYEQALEENPSLEDAQVNKKVVEELLEQQQQQENQQSENNQDENEQAGEDSDNQDQNGNQNGEQNDDSSSDSNPDSDNQNQEPGNEDSQSGEQDNGDQQNDANSPESQANNNEAAQNDPQPEQQESTGEQQRQQQAEQSKNEPEVDAKGQPIAETELTDEEKEEMQRMESLMRRVPDDPAFLLKRKMQLEAQKRQRQRMPSNRSDW